MDRRPLEVRLEPFLRVGLLDRVPTPLQLRLGELEMLPYVLSADATAEEHYTEDLRAHPIVRQALILGHVGRDHLDPGASLGARHASIVKHLVLTHHRGMPVFDLQLLATHERGLERLEAAIREQLDAKTERARRLLRTVATLHRDPRSYLEAFLGPNGYVARASRWDYPSAADEGSDMPEAFFSLAGFLRHCSARYPAHLADASPTQWATLLGSTLTRRLSEGRPFAFGRPA